MYVSRCTRAPFQQMFISLKVGFLFSRFSGILQPKVDSAGTQLQQNLPQILPQNSRGPTFLKLQSKVERLKHKEEYADSELLNCLNFFSSWYKNFLAYLPTKLLNRSILKIIKSHLLTWRILLTIQKLESPKKTNCTEVKSLVVVRRLTESKQR